MHCSGVNLKMLWWRWCLNWYLSRGPGRQAEFFFTLSALWRVGTVRSLLYVQYCGTVYSILEEHVCFFLLSVTYFKNIYTQRSKMLLFIFKMWVMCCFNLFLKFDMVVMLTKISRGTSVVIYYVAILESICIWYLMWQKTVPSTDVFR